VAIESEGVTLISSDAVEFYSLVDRLAPPGMATVLKDAKPYVVIVSNGSPRKIVALTVTSSFVGGGATPAALHMTYPPPDVERSIACNAPDAVGTSDIDFGDRSERGIPAGGMKLMGLHFAVPEVRPKFETPPDAPGWDNERIWNWVVSTTKDFADRIKRQGGGKPIVAKVETVIFDDGLIVGTDPENFLRNAFESSLKARQDLYKQIVELLDHGKSMEEAFRLKAASPDVAQLTTSMEFGEHYRSEAISTVTTLRKRYGDEAIRDVLRQAILKEPFVIHRK
jgi:hypothetical protein